MSYLSEVLADSPILHWKLDETSGTSAADASGNSRPGTYNNSPTLGGTSLVPNEPTGKAPSFNGSSQSVFRNSETALNVTYITVEAWFTLSGSPGANGFHAIAAKDAYSGARGWSLLVEHSTGILYWYGTRSDLVAFQAASSAGTISIGTGTTYHVAGTFDGTTARLYLNGVEIATHAPGGSAGLRVVASAFQAAKDSGSGTGRSLNGKVDEVSLFGSALSAARILAHYNAGAGAAPTTVNGGLVSEATSVQAGTTAVGVVRNGGLVSESTSVLAGSVTVGQVVQGGVVTETTKMLAGFATEGIIRYAGLVTESTTVLPGVTSTGVLVEGGLVSETTTLFAGSVIDGEQVVGGYITETTTVLGGTVELGYGTTIPDVPSGGRHRGGIGYASWLPAVVPTPDHLSGVGSGPGGAGYAQAVDKALAFGPVDRTGPQPVFAHVEAAEPRQRDRVVIGGVDVTYFRGAETIVEGYELLQPFGYGSATLSFPQIYPGLGDQNGVGDLAWLKDRAKVIIQRVNEDGSVVTDYRGKIEVHDSSTDGSRYEVRGALVGPASWRWRPMPLTRATLDIGFLLAQATRQLGLRVTPRLGPDTGIEVGRFGGMKFLEYMQGLIGRGWTRNGGQWTMMPDENGVFSIYQRDRDTIHGTCYLDKSSVEFSLLRDTSAEPNRIFGTSVTPSGMRYLNGAYPGMYDGDRAFPGFMTEGDTGDGVAALIQRLRITHYLNAETAIGGYDEDVTEAVERVQRKAGLTVTGNVNQATWNTIMSVDKQGASMKLARILPIAQLPETEPYNLTPDGSIESRNDTYDPTLDKVDAYFDFGTGFKIKQVNRFGDRQLEEAQTPNYLGTLRIQTGAIVAGEHTPGDPITAILRARDIRPGMNLWLPQFQGGTKVHVTAASWRGGIVELQVDTRARDAWNTAQIIEGRREAREDPAASFFRSLYSSRIPKDAISEWSEVGGEIERWELEQGWNVKIVPTGQSGTIRSIEFETNPNAETVAAVFGKNVWPKALQRLVGNPLSPEGAERWADEDVRRQLARDHALLFAAGDDTDPGGYSPGYKSGTSSIFTGKFSDDGSFPYYTDNQDAVFVAVYSDRATTIPAGRLMKHTQEPGA